MLVFQTPISTTEGTEWIHTSGLILALGREETPMTGVSSHVPYFQKKISQWFLHLLQNSEREEGFVKCSQLSRGKKRLDFLPKSQCSSCVRALWWNLNASKMVRQRFTADSCCTLGLSPPLLEASLGKGVVFILWLPRALMGPSSNTGGKGKP